MNLKSAYLNPAIDCNLGAARWALFLSIFTALAIALPYACHQFGIAGMVLLPMHFAVILAAIVMDLKGGLAVAFVSPVLSYLLSGMPPAASLTPITVELAAYALAVNLAAKRFKIPLVLSLIITMIAGRMVSMLFVSLILQQTPFSVQFHNLFVVGIPGIIIQLIFLPPVASKVLNFLKGR